MRIIDDQGENAIDGFNQLIDAKKNGEYAVWEMGGFITTTDDVPVDCDNMDYSEVIREMKVRAIERKEKLESAKEASKGINK